MTRRPARDDRGGATVLVLAMAGLLCFVAAALGAVAGVVHAQRVAQSAADLAALAAAAAVADGRDGCTEAAGTASANGAALATCAIQGLEVRLVVAVTGPRLVDGRVVVTAEARAGPSSGGRSGR